MLGLPCSEHVIAVVVCWHVGPFQLPAPQSGTLFRVSSATRPSVQTLSDVCLKRTRSLDTSTFSALEVLDDNRTVKIYLLTYLHEPKSY